VDSFKVVKVHIRRGGLGEDLMVYPSRYNAQEVDRMGVGPLNVMGAAAYSGHIGMGGTEEWCIILLPPSLARDYARDPDMEIITPEEADFLLEEWRVMRGDSEEIVKDPNRIVAIHAKQLAGIALTPEDLRALDPEDPIPGINKRVIPLRNILAAKGREIE